MQYAHPYVLVGQRSHLDSDELDIVEERLIQQAHCRRLEAATGGRLTFRGDRIVRA